jgi:UTP--glucose-1-phosphate uridylyltransferase
MQKLTSIAAAEDALAPYGYDRAQQARFVDRATSPATSNAVSGALTLLPETSLLKLPAIGSPERAALNARGLEFIRTGKVGVVVLAGGMATRFGGVVKAVVPALGERSFLQLKQADVAQLAAHAGGAVPLFVMSSFATHEVIKAHVAEHQLSTTATPVEVFAQKVALRLTPAGDVFVDADGELSPYATGHGDLVAALRSSGVLARFRAAGGAMLFMTNVDNLGATLDPAVLALHADSGCVISAEVVRKWPGDAGGAPAVLDGVPQIIEGFRFPKDFDQTQIGVFNTNTFTLDAAAIDREFELPYYRVEKKVDGAVVVQFERLVGELTALVKSQFIEVERAGEDSRFIPVKDPSDLTQQQAVIATVVSSKRSLR